MGGQWEQRRSLWRPPSRKDIPGRNGITTIEIVCVGATGLLAWIVSSSQHWVLGMVIGWFLMIPGSLSVVAYNRLISNREQSRRGEAALLESVSPVDDPFTDSEGDVPDA